MTVTGVEDLQAGIASAGFAIIDQVIGVTTIESLATDFGARGDLSTLARRSSIYGERNLLSTSKLVRDTACLPEIRGLVDSVLGKPSFAVRALYFDKVPGANWNLGWHQDLTIAVRGREETEGFGPWSIKAGVPHVHAPVKILESMISVRIHIDDCPAENGALRVVPGTHLRGRIPQNETDAIVRAEHEFVCAATAGSILMMRPLLLHASKSSASPRHRRVLHIEYAAACLPTGLDWQWRIGEH